MAKAPYCALTHVRHEHFFLGLWIAHYEKIVGRENLYVVIDGDDWTPEVDLSGINVETALDAPRRRIKNDRWAARYMSGRANQLRRQYRFVIRGDVDELVVVDPITGLNWDEALNQDAEQGYSYAIGVDMSQHLDLETNRLDVNAPILRQRQYGFVSDRYSKPFVISRWNNWAGGAHRLLNRPVKLNPNFILFHLALSDQDSANARHKARGGNSQHVSYHSHVEERFRMLEVARRLEVMPFERACELAQRDFPFEADGSEAKRPRASNDPTATEYGFYTKLPDRFWNLI